MLESLNGALIPVSRKTSRIRSARPVMKTNAGETIARTRIFGFSGIPPMMTRVMISIKDRDKMYCKESI